MSEPYVIVHRSYDPIVIEHLGEILREAGIAARVLGTRSAALIGVGSTITELHIGVPERQAGDATEFLEAYFADEGAELLARDGLLDDDDDDDEIDAGPQPLKPIIAGVAVVLTFGVGHLYARRPVTALLLAAGQLATFAVFTQFSFTGAAIAWGGAYGTIILYDLVGAQVAVRSFNRGVRRSRAYQLVAGAAALALAGTVAFTLGTNAPDWEPRHLLRGGYGDAPVRDRFDYKRYGDDYDPWIDPFSAPVPRGL
jgi:hypothetical protein